MKEQFTTTVRVAGKGESKSSRILLRIEPQDVTVVHAREAVRKEAFLFFFLRRERRTYSVELDVTVNVTAIDLDKVDFVTQT